MSGEHTYWEIEYTSCEGNRRLAIAKAPIDWDEYDVLDHVTLGGCGDDVAELISATEINVTDDNYSWDFTYIAE